MADNNVVLEGALVHCSFAAPIVGEKSDVENFAVYQYVHTSDNEKLENQHSAYQGRQILLNDGDIYITPFPNCYSTYYDVVMPDIIEDMNTKLKNNNSLSDEERKKQEDQLQVYRNAVGANGSSLSRANKDARACFMLVLDRWFQPSSSQYVDDYYAQAFDITERLKNTSTEIRKKISGIRNEYEKALPGMLERISNAIEASNPYDTDNLTIGNGYAYPDIGKISNNFNDEINAKKSALDRFDTLADDFKSKLTILEEAISSLSQEGIFFEDNYMNVDFTNLKMSLANVISAGANLAAYGSNEKFNDYLENLKEEQENIIEMETMITSLKSSTNALLTQNSKLVCKCGGIISIVFDGKWIDRSKEQVVVNLRKLLCKIEDALFKDIEELDDFYTGMSKQTSLIGAFKMIHELLLKLGGTSSYGGNPLLEEDGQVGIITVEIKPQSVIEKTSRKEDALLSFSEGLPYAGRYITIIKCIFKGIADTFSLGDGKDAFIAIASGTAAVDYLSAINTAGSYFNALSDLMYTTNADYTGMISITLELYNYMYKFTEQYDIYGNAIGYEMQKRTYGGPRDQIYWNHSINNSKLKGEVYFSYEFRVDEEVDIGTENIPLG